MRQHESEAESSTWAATRWRTRRLKVHLWVVASSWGVILRESSVCIADKWMKL